MAEYGANATTLPDPKGMGSNVISPVTTDGGIFPIVKELGSIFVKGLQQDAKDQALARKNAIVSNYVRTETTLNDAVATGQMTPQEASARSRANFNQYAGGYSEYIGDFEAAGKALRGFTETGEVQDKLKREKDIRNSDIDEARKAGFSFLPGMSKQAEDDQINAHKTRLVGDQQLEAMYKSNAEARAQGNFDQGVADRQAKDLSFRLINDIAGTNLQAFQSFSTSLADQVKTGKMTPDVAQATLSERFSNISGAIVAAARTNPELAAPYRSLFDDMNKVAQKMIDPKQQSDDLENQLKIIQTRMKLVAMTNPQIAATVVANQLLPNNPSLALSSAGAGIEAISLLSNTPISDNTKFTPQVVGNPSSEADTLKILKGALNDLKGGKIPEKEIANVQAGNSVNQILKQTGDFLNRGATPQSLKGLAQFFASPEYASFVNSGKIDKAAAGTAYKTFQLAYEPTIIKGVQQKFEEYLTSSAYTKSGPNKSEPVTIGQSIDVQFSGSGIVFKAKINPKLDAVEQKSQLDAVQQLTTAQTAINQLIHIGAHMEGSTDYNKYWEEHKHVFMPNIFPDPKKLKVGDVQDGYKYVGGAYNDPRSWQPAE